MATVAFVTHDSYLQHQSRVDFGPDVTWLAFGSFGGHCR